MWSLVSCGGFLVLAALSTIVAIIAVGGADTGWGKIGITLLGFLSLLAGILALEEYVNRRRPCPRCEVQGFEVLVESAKTTDGAEHFFTVTGCEHCGLHLLECGYEVMELDAERWEDEMVEWLRQEVRPKTG
jgi:hypothetical protein